MSKKKDQNQDPEQEKSFNMEEWWASMEKWAEEHKDHTTQLVWTTPKKVVLYALDSTLTKYVTDVAVAQYLTDFQKQAIKGFREAVLTLVDYYKNKPHGEEVQKMIDDCAKKLEQVNITCTDDLENPDKFIADGQYRPTLLMLRAFQEVNGWIFMDSDQDIQKIIDETVIDPNNVVGLYQKRIEQLAGMSYNNASAYLSDPDMEELTKKGEETIDYYLDRPEIDDSEKLKLQKTPNFKLPLSDVKKPCNNYGAYKIRLNNLFKKALKDDIVLTNEDLMGINQYLEEYLWYSANVYQNGEEEMGMDPVEAWVKATKIAEAVYLAIAKAFGYQKMRDIYNSNMEFHTAIKETLFNAMYLLCYYLTQLEDFDMVKKLRNVMDDITEEYGPDINNDLRLAEFFFFLEDLYECYC